MVKFSLSLSDPRVLAELVADVSPPIRLHYSIAELLAFAGLGTPTEYLASMRASLDALTGPDATEGLRELEGRIESWREAIDRPTLPGNREVNQAFVRGLDQLLQEVRARLVFMPA